MSVQHILKTVEFKLYPNAEQERTLAMWLRSCGRLYNIALAQRIKVHERRKKSLTYYDQCKWLTQWRSRIEWLREVPAWFARSALERLNNAFKSFFRRCKEGAAKPGFPKFKPSRRYRSMIFAEKRVFVRDRVIFIPGIGPVCARGQFEFEGEQKILRIIKRASGFYAQVVVEMVKPEPLPETGQTCGLDLGLESFLTLDTGEAIGNPRVLRKAAKKLRKVQQVVSRRVKGSNRRCKAVRIVAKIHERVARQRAGFCHRISRSLVNRFDHIAIEALNVKGLAAGMLAKSVNDAAWGVFINQLRYKSANAGRTLVEVDPSGTSQTCPRCGAVARKELSEREHNCPCGLRCHRDHASAQVIRQRAFRPVRGESIRPGVCLADSVKREDLAAVATQ